MKILFLHPYGSNFIKGVDDIITIFNLMPPQGILSIAAWVVINACFMHTKAFQLIRSHPVIPEKLTHVKDNPAPVLCALRPAVSPE